MVCRWKLDSNVMVENTKMKKDENTISTPPYINLFVLISPVTTNTQENGRTTDGHYWIIEP